MLTPPEAALRALISECNRTARSNGFWDSKSHIIHGPEKIALMHSELSEALEAMRDGRFTGPHSVAEELADTVIRIFDYAAEAALDLDEVIVAKMAHNRERPYKHGRLF